MPVLPTLDFHTSIFRQRNIIHLARVPAGHEIAILVPDLDVGTAPLERPAVAVSHLTFLEFFHLFLLSPWLSRRGKSVYCAAGKSRTDVHTTRIKLMR